MTIAKLFENDMIVFHEFIFVSIELLNSIIINQKQKPQNVHFSIVKLIEDINCRNSIPPTTTVSNLLAKQNAATGKICVDVGFWGGIIPGNANDLRSLSEAGVVGFKCFLHPSGDETFPFVTEDDVELACQQLTGFDALVAVNNFVFN